jgi:hypothetical protein
VTCFRPIEATRRNAAALVVDAHIVGRGAFTELADLCVWVKTDADVQAFYRPNHELVFLSRRAVVAGLAPHDASYAKDLCALRKA